jgi:MoaA/NifB/PqqE/SkfB family radical SAM enzyme
MTYAEYVRYCESFNAFMEKEGMCNLSTSPYKCPECDVQFDCGECPECHKDSGQFAPEPDHTCRPCDCCDRSTGELWDANGWSEQDQEIKEVRVCRDCEYFAEYGVLDDQTMMEVEKDRARAREEA